MPSAFVFFFLLTHLPVSSSVSVFSPRRKVQEQSAKIQIDAAKDRAKLDAAQRLKAAAEAEAKAKEVRRRGPREKRMTESIKIGLPRSISTRLELFCSPHPSPLRPSSLQRPPRPRPCPLVLSSGARARIAGFVGADAPARGGHQRADEAEARDGLVAPHPQAPQRGRAPQ